MTAAFAGWKRWLPLLGLVVVVGIVLWAGSRSRGRPSIDDRVHSVTATLRCPVCTGETVADSSAPISRDIRSKVRELLVAGETNGQAKEYILSKYPGTSLATPTTGLGLLVWTLPIVAIGAAIAGLTVAFRRWRVPAGVSVSDEDRRLVDEERRGGQF